MMQAEIPELDARGLRKFGLTTGAIVAGLFGVVLPWIFAASWPVWPWIVFALLAVWAVIAPGSLNPVYRGWMRLGILLGKITTPVILTLVFIVAFVPGALIMRLMRKDPMRRSLDSSATYRLESKTPSDKNLEKPY